MRPAQIFLPTIFTLKQPNNKQVFLTIAFLSHNTDVVISSSQCYGCKMMWLSLFCFSFPLHAQEGLLLPDLLINSKT